MATFIPHYVCDSLHIVAYSGNFLFYCHYIIQFIVPQMLMNTTLFFEFTLLQITLLKIFLYIYFSEHISKIVFAGHRVCLFPSLLDSIKLFLY